MTSASRKHDCRILPETAQLLVEGGDTRIALNAEERNKYGCPPFPDPDLVALGSSTASCISPAGFAAADRVRSRLQRASRTASDADIYAHEMERIRREFAHLCGVSGLQGLDVVFAASGTDLHLIAAQLADAADAAPLLAITVSAWETGRGVPSALAGRHFSSRTALGDAVGEDEPIFGGATGGNGCIETAAIPVRLDDGTPRLAADIDADFEAAASRAVSAGQRVLLVLADVTKTGMIVPSPACALALQKKFPHSVAVLVDACQFRFAPDTLRAYLEQGFMVALTGSKFVTGPPFSGALLIPEQAARRLRAQPLPRVLSAYSTRADWPEGWDASALPGDAANFGLLLRWEAALEELRAFRSVDDAAVTDFLEEFGNAVRERLAADTMFEALPAPALDRAPLSATARWDRVQTIFPFLLVDASAHGGRQPLSREQTMHIYRQLQTGQSGRCGPSEAAALRCQLGQPVACGMRNGVPVSALRLCASARLVVEATAQEGRNMRAVINKAIAALDKTALLVRAGCYRT